MEYMSQEWEAVLPSLTQSHTHPYYNVLREEHIQVRFVSLVMHPIQRLLPHHVPQQLCDSLQDHMTHCITQGLQAMVQDTQHSTLHCHHLC